MLETIIKLLERFVVAHELIAANAGNRSVVIEPPLVGEAALLQGSYCIRYFDDSSG